MLRSISPQRCLDDISGNHCALADFLSENYIDFHGDKSCTVRTLGGAPCAVLRRPSRRKLKPAATESCQRTGGVKLSAEIQGQLETARTTYRRFGRYSAALDRVQSCIECKAVEKAELEKMCSGLLIPGDFDGAQIIWRPYYDPLVYRGLPPCPP